MKKLFTAIRQRKLDEVKSIIEKKPELVNCVSGPLPKKDHGQSPLQVALKTGNYEIADYLISHGADINFMEAEDDDPGLRAPVLFDAINSTISSLCYERLEESDIAFEYVKLLVLLIENGADYVAWAHRGHYAEPYPGPSNKSMYLDDFVPGDETDTDKNKELRAFMQAYFKSRNLQVNNTNK